MKKFLTNLAMLRNVLFHSLLIFVTFFSFIEKGWGQTTLLSPTGDGGFETGTTFAQNGWVYIGSGGSRTWQLGTLGTQYAGNRHAYVGSTTNANGISSSAVDHFYKDFIIK